MTDRGVAVVTGGSRGIGAAITRRAVQEGYAVCFAYAQDSASAGKLLDEVEQGGGRAIAVRCDVARPEDVRSLFDQAELALGPVTAVVNNAGTTGRIGRFQDLDPEILRRVFDLNVHGTMYCTQEAVRRWTDGGRLGAVVNISSIAATLGAAGEYVHYAASKAAVEAFTVGLAKELGPAGIRVNAVSPGTILTGIHAAGGDPGRPARVAQRIPLGRAGEPEEIASAVLWLLSGEASYVTGAVLRAGGGL